MARPKKYHSQQERKAASKRSIAPQIKGKYFRLVIPDLTDFTNDPGALLALKGDTLNLLLERQSDLQYHKIATQTHPTTGVPHLDILLLYKKSVQKSLNRFDYLIKHGNLTRYKTLNQSILAYGDKQDKLALTNMPKQLGLLLKAKALQSDPYSVLKQQMLKDPFHFNSHQWLASNNLDSAISRTNWSKAINLIKHQQQAQCNRRLHDKAGFKLINRALIQQQLTSAQLSVYDSWSGYQIIVDHLNQMVVHRGDRDPKTLNLLITGAPNCGKSALVWHPKPHDHFNPISKYYSVYPIGMSQWFPKYQSDVYHCIYWNQAKLTSYSYDTILKLLDGSPLDLPNKGSVSRKVDNPLIIMTSNMTLQQMITQKFGYNKAYVDMARANLAVRVHNVIVPPNYNLFLLQKLLISSTK